MNSLLQGGVALTVSLALLLQISTVVAKATESPTELELISDAWRKQQDAVHSASFTIRGHQKYSTRPRVSPFLRPPAQDDAPGEQDPKFISSTFEVTVAFSGTTGAARIFSDRPMYDDSTKQFLQASTDTTFDGEDHSRSLMNREDAPNLMGIIHSKPMQNQDVGTVSYKPLFFAFRAFNAAYIGNNTLNDYSLSDDTDAVENSEENVELICLVSRGRELWIDSKDGYTLHKYVVTTHGGKTHAVVEVTRNKKHENIWIPMEWKGTYFGFDGKPRSWFEYKVKEFKINPPLTRKDFHLTFPEGTEVERIDNELPKLQLEKRQMSEIL